MSLNQLPNVTSPLAESVRSSSPGNPALRFRGIQRASTFGENHQQIPRRRSSFFSDALSETRRSIKSSTDDLLLPRVNEASSEDENPETSHWHSVPLGLALLPAVAGLLFKNGSAVVTDISLLALAAIFMNWSLRLPWEWYRAAQQLTQPETMSALPESPVLDEDGASSAGLENAGNEQSPTRGPSMESSAHIIAQTERFNAQHELRVHEVAALITCFAFPAFAAWLLHAIRSQLSRPSEGLVSDYNLTIFLLVAELRPVSHLMKLVQKRTLYVQRKANASILREQQASDRQQVIDLTNRLEELEAHVANAAATGFADSAPPDISTSLIAEASSQAHLDMRKSIQPELDALNRAMRRYEKRMTITAIQVEARLQDLESRVKDAVVLAAAAQRGSERQPRNYSMILLNWASAALVLPIQLALDILSLPTQMFNDLARRTKKMLNLSRRPADSRDVKSTARPTNTPKQRSNLKKTKIETRSEP